MDNRATMKRTPGWKVDDVPSAPYDLGLTPAPVMPTFTFVDAGVQLRINAGAGSRWHDVLCTVTPSTDEKEWTGKLANPEQSFTITLSTNGTTHLEGTVLAAATPNPRGGARGEDYGPPAGGSWTAQEGS